MRSSQFAHETNPEAFCFVPALRAPRSPEDLRALRFPFVPFVTSEPVIRLAPLVVESQTHAALAPGAPTQPRQTVRETICVHLFLIRTDATPSTSHDICASGFPFVPHCASKAVTIRLLGIDRRQALASMGIGNRLYALQSVWIGHQFGVTCPRTLHAPRTLLQIARSLLEMVPLMTNELVTRIATSITIRQAATTCFASHSVQMQQSFLVTAGWTRHERVQQMRPRTTQLMPSSTLESILGIPPMPFRFEKLEAVRQQCLA